MAELRKAWGGQCVACAWPFKLEFAHLHPTGLEGARARNAMGDLGRGRGLPQRYHDVKNHPECYILLCHGCHEDLDRGEMPRAAVEVTP
jgi:hypothetical protein